MANTYRNSGVALTSQELTTIYAAPPSTTSIVNDIIIANASTGAENTVNIILTDTSASTDYYVISGAALPVSSNFSPLPGSLVMEATDILKANVSTVDTNGVHIIASVLEITS